MDIMKYRCDHKTLSIEVRHHINGLDTVLRHGFEPDVPPIISYYFLVYLHCLLRFCRRNRACGICDPFTPGAWIQFSITKAGMSHGEQVMAGCDA